MTEPKRVRLFVAARVPEPQLLLLKRMAAPLKGAIDDARWTPPENQHLTLKFLGSTPADLLEPIGAAVDSVAAHIAPDKVSLSGLGAFPTPRRARVLWAGVDDPSGLLPRLAEGLDTALGPLGFEPEKRKFMPHLTLARLRTPAPVAEAMQGVRLDEAFTPFLVGSIDLFSSKLSPHGARYEVLNYFELRGPRRKESSG
ncbi:MAG: RNA 2',3'-cyclic phosphodiesterase [Actinomycetota bacterium]